MIMAARRGHPDPIRLANGHINQRPKACTQVHMQTMIDGNEAWTNMCRKAWQGKVRVVNTEKRG